MRIQKLHIKNFRYIRSLEICDIENALILVGKNNVGKTAVLSALCAVGGQYEIAETDFNEKKQKYYRKEVFFKKKKKNFF
mgnify:CR=1 FL=1